MPDGGVAEVRGAGADAGDSGVAVVGLRRQAAALYGRHAAFEAILIYNEHVRLIIIIEVGVPFSNCSVTLSILYKGWTIRDD